MKNRKNLELTLLLILATTTLISPAMATPDPEALSIVPQTNTGNVGDTFTITYEIDAGVTNLWGFGILLRYNTTVLTATAFNISPDFPNVFPNVINDTIGYVDVAAALPYGTTVGVNGPRWLAKIDFVVEGLGESILDIDETVSALMTPDAKTIPVTIIEGYFSNVVIQGHDVAVTNVAPSLTTVEADAKVSIAVTVTNRGVFNETVRVSTYYNETRIETKTNIFLAVGNTTTINFSWNTKGVPPGTYIISANVAIVYPDDNPDDNTYVDGTVTVKASVRPPIPLYAIAVTAMIIAAGIGIYALRARKPKPKMKPRQSAYTNRRSISNFLTFPS